MKRPEELDADTLWQLLGWYASTVVTCEGLLFTDNKFVVLAVDQWDEDHKPSKPRYPYPLYPAPVGE